MRDASIAILKEIANVGSREKLSIVAQAFVDLQQARHKADYDIEEPFQPLDAAVDVAQARLAFVTWAEVRDEPIAQRYLYSLLFKDRS